MSYPTSRHDEDGDLAGTTPADNLGVVGEPAKSHYELAEEALVDARNAQQSSIETMYLKVAHVHAMLAVADATHDAQQEAQLDRRQS